MNIFDELTVFDFETTGTDPEQHRVIEVAAVKYRKGEVFAQFSSIVRQEGPFEPKAVETNGINEEMSALGMDENLMFRILKNFIGNDIIVGHNIGFDMAFYHYGLLRNGAQASFENRFIDTLTIARNRKPYPHKLSDCTEHWGVKLEGAHRALNDVMATGDLLKALHAEQPVDDFINLIAYYQRWGPPKWLPNYAQAYAAR